MRKWRLAVAVAVGALLAGGCSSAVAGVARPIPIITPTDVRPVLLDPAEFPDEYPAVVLPQPVAAQAAADMSGLSVGAEGITPDGCTPDSPPNAASSLAVAVGSNNTDRSTLTLIVENVGDANLAKLRDYLSRCGDITAHNRAAEISVHTELLAVPAKPGEPALSWRRAVRSGNAQTSIQQTMVTMVGQVGRIRVLVTYLTFAEPSPNLDVMKALLNSQLAKLQHS